MTWANVAATVFFVLVLPTLAFFFLPAALDWLDDKREELYRRLWALPHDAPDDEPLSEDEERAKFAPGSIESEPKPNTEWMH